MDKEKFDEYCRMFSTTDDKGSVFDRYYSPEATFEHPFKGIFKGREAIVNFWTEGHKGIQEVLKPTNMLFEGDGIAAEFRIEWHCVEDTDYLGPRKKGEVYCAECAAFYHLEDDRIVRVKLYLKEL